MSPKLPLIYILDYESAETLLGLRNSHGRFSHVISINDPGEDPPAGFMGSPAKKLLLTFHDVVGELQDDRIPPTRDHVQSVLDFAQDIQPGQRVLIHCTFGASRSPAVALIVAASKVPKSEKNAQAVCKFIQTIKPDICPNHRLVEFGDDLLGWEGKLSAASTNLFGKLSDPLAGIQTTLV